MNSKKIYLEILRIIAFSFVIYNHTNEYCFSLFTLTGSFGSRILSIMLANISKIGVPLFLMISGALLIPKKEGIGALLKRRILKMFIILIAVSLLYYIRLYIRHPEYGFSIRYFFQLIYSQPFVTPLWFLYTYIAFLVMLPFLRRMALSMKEDEYFFLLVICLLFGFVIPVINHFNFANNYLSIPLLSMAIIYPLTGYYIDAVFNPRRLAGRFLKIIHLSGERYLLTAFLALIINALITAGLTYNAFLNTGQWNYDCIEGMIYIPAFCIFYMIRTLCIQHPLPDKASRIISYIGSCIFITYLSEEMLREDIFMIIYRRWSDICSPFLLFIPYMICIYISGIIIASVLKQPAALIRNKFADHPSVSSRRK